MTSAPDASLANPVYGAAERKFAVSLYMAALTALRCNPAIRRFAGRLRERGKVFKMVITACMRKLLIVLNTMMRNQTLWRPEKILKNA